MPSVILLNYIEYFIYDLEAEFLKVNTLFEIMNQSLGFLPNSSNNPASQESLLEVPAGVNPARPSSFPPSESRRASAARAVLSPEIMLGIPAPRLIR